MRTTTEDIISSYNILNMQCELLEAAGEISIRATNVGTSPFAMRDVPLLSSSFFAAVSAENSPSLGTSHPLLPYLPSHSLSLSGGMVGLAAWLVSFHEWELSACKSWGKISQAEMESLHNLEPDLIELNNNVTMKWNISLPSLLNDTPTQHRHTFCGK